MTKFSQITADRRAQVFALLRHSSPEHVKPSRPAYLDEAASARMIARALTSFDAPPLPDHAETTEAP